MINITGLITSKLKRFVNMQLKKLRFVIKYVPD